MKKSELKDYNRLLRDRNEVLEDLMRLINDSLEGDCRCEEIKLLREENTELVKDLNDLKADWAKSNTIAYAAVHALVRDIDDLQAEWAADHVKTVKAHEADCSLSDMTLQEFERINEDLIAQRDRAVQVIQGLRSEKYNSSMELEKLKKENAELGSQILDYKEDILNLQGQLGV